MEFLKFLESIRNPVCDFFFSLITHIGEETVFMLVALAIFWCIGKREGLYVLITGLVGTVANQFLKILCKVPRPWVADAGFKPVGDAIEEATGYSFPSGHTQNVTGTLGCVASAWYKKKRVWIPCVVIILLVAFSRMYLGVHYPKDVLFSLVFATVLLIALRPIFMNEARFYKFMPYITVIANVITLAFLIYVFLQDPANYDGENLASAMKNASTLFGCTLALVPVWFIDQKYIKFETDGKWYAQILKLLGGFVCVLLVKELMRAPLEFICFGQIYVARAIRYFLIVVVAGTLWPLTFKFFKNLRIKALDNLFNKKGSKEA